MYLLHYRLVYSSLEFNGNVLCASVSCFDRDIGLHSNIIQPQAQTKGGK